MISKVQVAPEHYAFEKYDDLERWSSYWHQLRAALSLRPKSVLEIGSGTGVFRSYLRQAGVEVRSVDIDASRAPDWVGDVSALDEALPEGLRFDVVAAFQVLEHLPFDKFEACLAGLARRGRHALISLPRHGFQLRLSLGVARLRPSVGIYVPYPWRHRHVDGGEHHWEVGVGYSVRRVTRLMRAHFDVLRRGHVPENPYHYMWVLRARAEPPVSG